MDYISVVCEPVYARKHESQTWHMNLGAYWSCWRHDIITKWETGFLLHAICVCVCVCVCVCLCTRAHMHACMRACTRVCLYSLVRQCYPFLFVIMTDDDKVHLTRGAFLANISTVLLLQSPPSLPSTESHQSPGLPHQLSSFSITNSSDATAKLAPLSSWPHVLSSHLYGE